MSNKEKLQALLGEMYREIEAEYAELEDTPSSPGRDYEQGLRNGRCQGLWLAIEQIDRMRGSL